MTKKSKSACQLYASKPSSFLNFFKERRHLPVSVIVCGLCLIKHVESVGFTGLGGVVVLTLVNHFSMYQHCSSFKENMAVHKARSLILVRHSIHLTYEQQITSTRTHTL